MRKATQAEETEAEPMNGRGSGRVTGGPALLEPGPALMMTGQCHNLQRKKEGDYT